MNIEIGLEGYCYMMYIFQRCGTVIHIHVFSFPVQFFSVYIYFQIGIKITQVESLSVMFVRI